MLAAEGSLDLPHISSRLFPALDQVANSRVVRNVRRNPMIKFFEIPIKKAKVLSHLLYVRLTRPRRVLTGGRGRFEQLIPKTNDFEQISDDFIRNDKE